MAMTRKELIKFLDGLVELASEENKVKAVLLIREEFYFKEFKGILILPYNENDRFLQ